MKLLLIPVMLVLVAVIGIHQINAEQVNLMHSWDLKYFDDLQLTYAVDFLELDNIY